MKVELSFFNRTSLKDFFFTIPFILCLFTASRMIIGGFSSLYIISRGLSYWDLALLKSFQAFLIFFLEIPLAYLSDKFSRKKILLAGILCATIWLFLTGYALSKSVFFIAEFFNALSLALISGTINALIVENSSQKEEVKRNLSHYYFWNFIAMATGSLIGGLFFTMDSLVWYFASFVCFLSFLLAVLLIQDKEKGKSSLNKGFMINLREDYVLFREILGRTQASLFVIFFLTYILVLFVYQILIQYWQILFQEAHLLLNSHLIYISTFFVAILLVQSLSAFLINKIHRRDLLYFFNILCFFSSLLLFLSFYLEKSYGVLIGILLFFFSLRGVDISFSAYFHLLLPDQMRATFDSCLSGLNRLFLFVFLPFLGFLINIKGIGSLLLFFLGIFSIVLISLFWGRSFFKRKV